MSKPVARPTSDLIERAFAVVRGLPLERQDEIARMVLFHAEQEMAWLTPKEEADLAESLAQADRGEFATDEEVQAVWAKFAR